jgi:alpha-L-rhamnosidase
MRRALALLAPLAACARAQPHFNPPSAGAIPGLAPQPWGSLSGGAFDGPAVPLSPDPLVSYRWGPAVNSTPLQIYAMYPLAVELAGTTDPASFGNLSSLLSSPTSASVAVTGAGGFSVDFGTENAAWLEVDVVGFDAAADLGKVLFSVSEWSEAYLGKILTPKAYTNASAPTMTTLRLETNDQLYEGVRFGFVTLTAAPQTPFQIVSVRAVAQAKPVNYTGSFSAPGSDPDADLLTRIWYASIYTVRTNLEVDYFGAILMDRGDRISWTGDAHVAQSAAMTGFGNFAFVLNNLQRTSTDSNGIRTYALYWCLSALEYFRRSGDSASFLSFSSTVLPQQLEIAQQQWADPTGLSFVGWDDRLGAGFANATTTESQFLYRFLAMRAWKEFAVAIQPYNATAAAHYQGYYDTAAAAVRSTWGPTWYVLLGIHAAADAINAGFVTPAETAALLSTVLNDEVTACSLSNFNQYWLLQALGNAGAMDKATATIVRCWGAEIALGATTFWEISSPEWPTILRALQPMPFGYNGETSLCHPWSAGAAPWMSAHMTGVTPLRPGYASVRVRPHVPRGADGVRGAVPVPVVSSAGSESAAALAVEVDVRVGVGEENNGGSVRVTLPGGGACAEGGELHLTEKLLARLGWAFDEEGVDVEVEVVESGGVQRRQRRLGTVRLAWDEEASATAALLSEGTDGSPDTVVRGRAAVLKLAPGTDVLVTRAPKQPVSSSSSSSSSTSSSSPFPPPSWPARLQEVDLATSGSWLGRYGSAGYWLPHFNPDGSDAVSLPSFISSVVAFGGTGDSWTDPDPLVTPSALQDPRGPSYNRSIGVSYGSCTTAVDVWMQEGQEGDVLYQVAAYIVDYDDGRPSHEGLPPRRETVQLLDRLTLNPAGPTQYLPSPLDGGVWVVYQYSRSLRLRFSQLMGDNAVVSALLFDVVE